MNIRVETILLDDADEVKNNYGSMAQEYRANFATTLLRTAFGTLSKRLNGVRLDLADRTDLTQRRLRQLTCIESVLRTLFPGVPALDPIIWVNKMNEVQKYLSLTGHFYSPAPLTMSKRKFDKLKPEWQKLFMEAALKAAAFERKVIRDAELKQIEELVAFSLLSEEQLDIIKKKLNKGGVK